MCTLLLVGYTKCIRHVTDLHEMTRLRSVIDLSTSTITIHEQSDYTDLVDAAVCNLIIFRVLSAVIIQ